MGKSFYKISKRQTVSSFLMFLPHTSITISPCSASQKDHLRARLLEIIYVIPKGHVLLRVGPVTANSLRWGLACQEDHPCDGRWKLWVEWYQSTWETRFNRVVNQSSLCNEPQYKLWTPNK